MSIFSQFRKTNNFYLWEDITQHRFPLKQTMTICHKEFTVQRLLCTYRVFVIALYHSQIPPLPYPTSTSSNTIGGSRGCCRRVPPKRIHFFHFCIHFHQNVYGLQVGVPPQWVGTPPQREILDPPLNTIPSFHHYLNPTPLCNCNRFHWS